MAMKTEKKFRAMKDLKLLVILSGIAAVIFTFSFCGKNRSSVATLTEITPPSLPLASLADSVFIDVDEMAQFPNGEKGLMEYVANNTNYPDEAKKKNITGKVIVRFVVGKDCLVSHVEVANGVDQLLDAEAVRVVSSLPEFEKPAKKAGEPVSVQLMIPIMFALK